MESLPPTNPVFQKCLEEKKATMLGAVGKVVASTTNVASKPTPTPNGGNQKKYKETLPPLLNKKAGKEHLATDNAKKQRATLASPTTTANAWVPSLREKNGNLIPADSKVFSNHALVSQLNQVKILLRDYDTCMAMEEEQCLARLERALY